MSVVWIRNDSGLVTLAEDHAAEASITGGPAAPDEFSNDAGVRVISDAEAAEALDITEDEAKEIREPADSGLSPVPPADPDAEPEAEPVADEDEDEGDESEAGPTPEGDEDDAQEGDAEGEADPEQ